MREKPSRRNNGSYPAALGEFACAQKDWLFRVIRDLVASALPVRSEEGVIVRVFSGAYGDLISTTLNHHPVLMSEVRVENVSAFQHSIAATNNSFIHPLEGGSRSGPPMTF